MKIRKLIGLSSLVFALFTSVAFIAPENTSPQIVEEDGDSFAVFLSHFEKTDLPFAIELKDLQDDLTLKNVKKSALKKQKMGKQNLNVSPLTGTKYIPEASSMFSRMGPPLIEPVARFYPNEKMIAVVYSSQRRFGAGFKQYSLLVYDFKGNIIFPKQEDQFSMAFNLAQANNREKTTCRIDEQGNIFKNTYIKTQKKSLKKASLPGNELAGFELSNSEFYKLNDDGKIVQLKEISTDVRASLD